MKCVQKYMVIVLAVFFALFQSVHIFEHTLDSLHKKNDTTHNDNNKSNTKLDCQICQFHLTSTINEKQSIEEIVFKVVQKEKNEEYDSQLDEYDIFDTLKQRPPPLFIS